MSKTQFDPEKLHIYFEDSVTLDEVTSAVARVYSYDGGEKRIKLLSRLSSSRGGEPRTLKQFPPLKTSEQVEQVAELLSNCRQYL